MPILCTFTHLVAAGRLPEDAPQSVPGYARHMLYVTGAGVVPAWLTPNPADGARSAWEPHVTHCARLYLACSRSTAASAVAYARHCVQTKG